MFHTKLTHSKEWVFFCIKISIRWEHGGNNYPLSINRTGFNSKKNLTVKQYKNLFLFFKRKTKKTPKKIKKKAMFKGVGLCCQGFFKKFLFEQISIETKTF